MSVGICQTETVLGHPQEILINLSESNRVVPSPVLVLLSGASLHSQELFTHKQVAELFVYHDEQCQMLQHSPLLHLANHSLQMWGNEEEVIGTCFLQQLSFLTFIREGVWTSVDVLIRPLRCD